MLRIALTDLVPTSVGRSVVGTLVPYGFQIDGLKLGGFGVHQVKLKGDVWDLYDLGDFPGLYAAAEVGYTADDAGEGDVWLQNDKGVKLRLKSPQSEGIALDLGVEGIDIRME